VKDRLYVDRQSIPTVGRYLLLETKTNIPFTGNPQVFYNQVLVSESFAVLLWCGTGIGM
jgi:hypothetical protein